MAPRVSVIMATYNRRATLRCAIASVLGQTLEDFELLVVGDGCTDGSEEEVLALGDRRIRWIGLERNAGSQAVANNEGMRQAKGELIAFLGHDDLWFPWHLAALASHLDATGAEFTFGMAALLDVDGVHSVIGPDDLLGPDMAVPSTWVLRRSFAEKVGPWADPSGLAIAVDHDWFRRAVRFTGSTVAHADLTVLKFLSVWWRMYARTEFPQPEYLARLKTDAVSLHREILVGCARLVARERLQRVPVRAALGLVFRGIRRAGLNLYGQDRWPLSSLLRWRYQRARARLRLVRGL